MLQLVGGENAIKEYEEVINDYIQKRLKYQTQKGTC